MLHGNPSPVQYRNNPHYLGPCFGEASGGLHGLGTRAHDVLDQGRPLAALEVAFYAAPCTVLLGGFADDDVG